MLHKFTMDIFAYILTDFPRFHMNLYFEVTLPKKIDVYWKESNFSSKFHTFCIVVGYSYIESQLVSFAFPINLYVRHKFDRKFLV